MTENSTTVPESESLDEKASAFVDALIEANSGELTGDELAQAQAEGEQITGDEDVADIDNPDEVIVASDIKPEDEEKRIFIMVTMQQDKALFDYIDADAKANAIGRAAMARQILARAYNYQLNESATRTHKKYATEEEKVAARKSAAKSRNEQIKLLREQHKLKQELRALKASDSTDVSAMNKLAARIEAIDNDLLAD